MELTIIVPGSQEKCISGVTRTTTTTQIVHALAHAIKCRGRYILVACLGPSREEHPLQPTECPLQLVERCSKEGLEMILELRRLGELGEEEIVGSEANHSLPHFPQPQISDIGDAKAGGRNIGIGVREQRASCSNGDGKRDKIRGSTSQQIEQQTRIYVASLSSSVIAPVIHSSTSFHQLAQSGTEAVQHQMGRVDSAVLRRHLAENGRSPEVRERGEESGSSPSSSSTQSSGKRWPNGDRPPPPAYNAVLASKFDSLAAVLERGGGAIANECLNIESFEHALRTNRYSREELSMLLHVQREQQMRQQEELMRIEAILNGDIERELLQLEKQHNNLRTVLNSLRNGNWAERLPQEQAEAVQLNDRMEELRAAIGERRRELDIVREEERSLQLRYHHAITIQKEGTSALGSFGKFN